MIHTESTRELYSVELSSRGDGLFDCYLRKNITHKDITGDNGVTQTVWFADELYFATDKTKEEIESDFDAIWSSIEKSEMTELERIEKSENDILDVQEGIVEIYESIAGGM